MRRWTRFFIIFVAYGIALLHTAVPHHHDEAPGGQATLYHAGCHFAHSKANFLQLIFSTDLGYGHLEVFKKNADTKIDFSTAPASQTAAVLPPDIQLTVERASFGFSNSFIGKRLKQLLLFSATPFRAPPLTA